VYRLGVLVGRAGSVETPRASGERHDRDNDVANQQAGETVTGERAWRTSGKLSSTHVGFEPTPGRRLRPPEEKRALHILTDADERDDQADARDSAATTRDTAAGLRSFLHDGEQEYGPALKARRSAALDRTDSKADRTSAAADRTKLTEDDPMPPGVDNG
jgi:hypothetical protein